MSGKYLFFNVVTNKSQVLFCLSQLILLKQAVSNFTEITKVIEQKICVCKTRKMMSPKKTNTFAATF